ncbi:MAG: MarR family transcriptional regulator [Bifidobacteriaceae bacterium]|nr:MarR family transcriptional regulator [Bifidobacteriaceae bacterium]
MPPDPLSASAGPSGPSGHVAAPAEEQLTRLLPDLWRGVVQATRVVRRLPPLPEAQVAALQTLARFGPLTPAALAKHLCLARPTVSNIVRELVGAGFIERRKSTSDGRSVILEPTARASAALASFNAGRLEVMAKALADLAPGEREALVAALPALGSLRDNLRAVASASGGPGGPGGSGGQAPLRRYRRARPQGRGSAILDGSVS